MWNLTLLRSQDTLCLEFSWSQVMPACWNARGGTSLFFSSLIRPKFRSLGSVLVLCSAQLYTPYVRSASHGQIPVVNMYFGFKFCPYIFDTVGLRVPTRNFRESSVFNIPSLWKIFFFADFCRVDGIYRTQTVSLRLSISWCTTTTITTTTNFSPCGAAAQRRSWPPHSWGFWITRNDASQSVGLLWTSDHFVAKTSTWQHTTLTTDKHPCLRWDSNPRF